MIVSTRKALVAKKKEDNGMKWMAFTEMEECQVASKEGRRPCTNVKS